MTVRRVKSGAMKASIYVSAAVVCILAAAIAIVVLVKGLPHITLQFLTEKPSLLTGTIGILPNILNTLYIIFFTMVIVIPLGIGAAVYLNEYAKNKKLTGLIGLAAETLSGIPSIIYGLVGMLIFVQFCGLGSTLTVSLYMYAKERGEFDTAFAVAAILLILTLLLNFGAKYAQKHFAERS